MPTLLQHSPFAQTRPSAGPQVDWGHPLAQGLVGCWSFLEGGGKLTTSLNSVSALGTAVTWLPSGNLGALNFPNDGTNGLITVTPSPAMQIADIFSFSFWIKRAAIGANHGVYSNNKWEIFINTSNQIDLILPTISDNVSTGLIADTNWHHVVVTRNVSGTDNAVFYIDGRGAGTASPAALTAPTGNHTIGKEIAFNIPMNGALAAIRFYNRVLSASEVQQLYNEPYAMLRGPDVYRRYR